MYVSEHVQYLGFAVSFNNALTGMQFGGETSDGNVTDFVVDCLRHCRCDVFPTVTPAKQQFLANSKFTQFTQCHNPYNSVQFYSRSIILLKFYNKIYYKYIFLNVHWAIIITASELYRLLLLSLLIDLSL